MIVVALGANLPGPDGASPLAMCAAAAEALHALPGLRLESLSQWYATAPIPASDQPEYVNGAALLTGVAEPVRLLRWLQGIEAGAGRLRGAPNAARVLDLDIIAIDDMIRQGHDPLLPHPRMHERAFVLRPMADLVPDWRHPQRGVTVAEMLAALPAQGIRVL